jgi:hypothetical protein
MRVELHESRELLGERRVQSLLSCSSSPESRMFVLTKDGR